MKLKNYQHCQKTIPLEDRIEVKHKRLPDIPIQGTEKYDSRNVAKKWKNKASSLDDTWSSFWDKNRFSLGPFFFGSSQLICPGIFTR